jgi:hypothetical protein
MARLAAALSALVVVACASAPRLDDSDTAEIYRTTAAAICSQQGCEDVLILDSLVSLAVPGSQPLSPLIREAVVSGSGGGRVVSGAQVEDLMARGEGFTVLYVGPLAWYRADVVGVEFGVSCGPLCGSGTVYLYRWDGSGWRATTPEEVDVTVVSWVS